MKSKFQRSMEKGIVICAVLTVVSAIGFLWDSTDLFFSLLITSATTLYHIAMRVLVGTFMDKRFQNGINDKRQWFMQKPFEKQLFHILQIRRWKLKIPTYAPEKFSLKTNPPKVIIQNMCIAEVIHEWSIILSFVPAILSFFLFRGEVYRWIFVVTSILAGAVDGLFVLVQRYNRPRLIEIMDRQRTRK